MTSLLGKKGLLAKGWAEEMVHLHGESERDHTDSCKVAKYAKCRDKATRKENHDTAEVVGAIA